jgi:hypothetical protein
MYSFVIPVSEMNNCVPLSNITVINASILLEEKDGLIVNVSVNTGIMLLSKLL